MDAFWLLAGLFLVVSFFFRALTAPARAADTLKRIERKLRDEHGSDYP